MADTAMDAQDRARWEAAKATNACAQCILDGTVKYGEPCDGEVSVPGCPRIRVVNGKKEVIPYDKGFPVVTKA